MNQNYRSFKLKKKKSIPNLRISNAWMDRYYPYSLCGFVWLFVY